MVAALSSSRLFAPHYTWRGVTNKNKMGRGKLDEFLESILTTEKAKIWLRVNLSTAFTLWQTIGRVFASPKLWLCTGIFRVTNATGEVKQEASKGGAGETRDPTSTMPVGGKVGGESGKGFKSRETIEGESIWAAQWMSLKCNEWDLSSDELEEQKSIYNIILETKYCKGQRRIGGIEKVYRISADGEDVEDAITFQARGTNETNERNDFDEYREMLEAELGAGV